MVEASYDSDDFGGYSCYGLFLGWVCTFDLSLGWSEGVFFVWCGERTLRLTLLSGKSHRRLDDFVIYGISCSILILVN